MSSQYVAAASQNFTCPAVNAADPALTAAVNVTTVSGSTDVTGAPAAVTARVVDVVAGAALTVTASCVLSIRAPEEPVITTVAFPGVAELLAVSVSKLVPVEIGFGAKVAVTPGNPTVV